MKKTFLFLLMVSFAFCDDTNENVEVPKQPQELDEPTEDFYYDTRFTLGGFYHYQEKTSAKHKGTFFGEADILIPIFQSSRTLFFVDLRGLDFEGRSIEGNFGLGLRHIFESYNWMLGVYSFYDRKRSMHSNFFNQITAGLEIKTKRFTFDANAYIPFGKTRRLEGVFGDAELRPGVFPFQYIWFGEGFEVALWGFDGEIGYNIWKSFSLFAGGFYFHRDNVETVAGPMARMYYTFDFADSKKAVFDKIILEVGGSYDHIREWRYYAGVKISWVFGEEKKKKQKPKGLAKRMTEYVRRDYDVITNGDNGGVESFQRLNKSDGSPVNVQLVSDLAGLNQATGNGADVIGVLTTIIGVGGTSILADGQTVTGKNYFFGNNMSIQLSEGGQVHSNDLQVTNDTTIRDLTLKSVTIQNNPSTNPHMGDLKVENVVFDGAGFLIDIFTNLGGVTNLWVDNCQFNNATNDSIWLHNIDTGTLNIKSFTNNVIDGTASGHVITILLAALGNNTSFLSIDDFSNNTITVDTGGAVEVTVVDIRISAEGGLPNMTNTASIGNIVNNRIEIKGGGNQHKPLSIQNEIGGGAGATQTTTAQNISNNTFIVASGNSHIGLAIENVGGSGDSGNQTMDIKTIDNNTVQIGAGTGNIGILLNSDIQTASITSDFKAGEKGGFFGNTISLGATSTDDIQIFNSGSNSTVEIKVNDGGKDLSDANIDANVTKAGTNQDGIRITP